VVFNRAKGNDFRTLDLRHVDALHAPPVARATAGRSQGEAVAPVHTPAAPRSAADVYVGNSSGKTPPLAASLSRETGKG
jgi:hypothetical protein